MSAESLTFISVIIKYKTVIPKVIRLLYPCDREDIMGNLTQAQHSVKSHISSLG